MMRSGIISARELTEIFLARIAQTDEAIQAWVLVDAERARLEADAVDRKIKSRMPLGPLHGIPVGIKDVIDVAEWPTAAGSSRWRHSIAREDAPCVTMLRNAGAVLLGKTVTTPFASFDPAPTLNPRYPGRTPGGSSAGSAAAVAAGHCYASLGTQTGGSILRPAAYCGVAAYKPTFGAIPKKRVVPLAPSLDHVGVIASGVSDLRAMARCLNRKYQPGDESNVQKQSFLVSDGLFNSAWVNPDYCRIFDVVVSSSLPEDLPRVPVSLPGEIYGILEYHRILMASEAFDWHSERWSRFPEDYPECFARLLAEGQSYGAKAVLEAQRYRRELKSILRAWWPVGGFLIMPATTSPPPDRSSTGDPRCQSPWSFLGWPTIGIPVPKASGCDPFSIQVVGMPGSDNSLLELGLRLEMALSSSVNPS